ncbi:FecR domain-containing protein [Steroidobacter sp. S1-65]|uniref:FecR domain-containing protein n=1 Tax=Steroidobacter gossypii TaxID=2805490 RepID=A0ABS1X2R6_9GAMM|nr:FecR domain-containing protein [Steroidobacter gossypii]MBM0107487.1 FecR domain-containing protein [Steroidobacter gossypii]
MNEQPPAIASASRRETLLEEAALWRAQLDSNTADVAEFERWRDADPAHAIAFARIASTWSAVEDVAWSGTVIERADKPRTVVSRRRAIAWFTGAMTLGAAGLITYQSLARETVETSTGERRSLDLPQSVRLDMNTATALSWRASNNAVKLWLDHGEIAVRVAATAALLWIETSNIEALLSAGVYNARFVDRMLDLTVVRGAAQLRAPPAKAIAVTAGQRLLAADGATALQSVSEQDLDAIEAWQRGEIVFQDTQLSAAVAEYNRYLQRKLMILDPAVGELRIGGRFNSADVSTFLRAIEITLRVTSVQSDGAVVLVRKT